MLIINGKVVKWGEPAEILEDQAILIKDGVIIQIGKQADLLQIFPEEELVNAHSQYVMPGNICAHTHFYGAFSRGMSIQGGSPKNFLEILQKLWWPLDKSLSLEDVKYSALVCIIDAIRHGTTTLIDHHASQNAIMGSLDKIAEAVDETGIRAVLCYEVTDRDGEDKALQGIIENVRFINNLQTMNKKNEKIGASFGLHASLTLSDNTLNACRKALPDDFGFHIHLAEDAADQNDSLEKYHTRVVDRLYHHGILGEKTIAAHAVHVDAREIALLAQTGTWVTHQPRSNMNNAVGVAQVESMLRAGVKIAMGNDGFSNNMWEEWKTAYLVQKLWNHDPRSMNGADLIKIAVDNTAQLANIFFPKQVIGKMETGAQADLIFVDYHPITPLIPDNLPWHLLFAFNESMITTTIVSGKVLMHDRKLLTIDEESIAEKARTLAPEIWVRYNQQFNH
jgi:putative selenium metabolism protein SsnA